MSLIKSEVHIGKDAVFIEGKIAPLNESNAYGETVTADSFKWQLGDLGKGADRPFLMFFKHKNQRTIGLWHKVWLEQDGIYAKGIVFDPAIVKVAQIAKILEQPLTASISYLSGGKRTLRQRASSSIVSMLLMLPFLRLFTRWFAKHDNVVVSKALLTEASITDSPLMDHTALKMVQAGRMTMRRADCISRALDRAVMLDTINAKTVTKLLT